MRAHVRARLAVVSGLIVSVLAASAVDAATKTRTVLVLPFVTVDLGRDEQWLGEAMAQ